VAPSTTTSRPGRLLIVLAVIIIAMLAGVLRGNITNPSKWHSSFQVGLGLDLSSGTTITLQAVTKKHTVPSQSAMNEARNIMVERVDEAGFNGALVQQQGNENLAVSVPGQGAEKVAAIVGQTALLRFRQVLLCSGISTFCEPTSSSSSSGSSSSPSPSPSTTGGSSSPSPTTSGSTSPSSSASTSTSSSKGAGKGQAVGATRFGSSSSPKATSSAKASGSPSPTSSPSGSSTATASPSPTSTAPAVTGNQALVNKATLALFNKLNCNDKNWQEKIYHTSTGGDAFDDPSQQVVACGTGAGKGIKYVLAPAAVTGGDLTSISAALNSTNNQWQVNFGLNGKTTTSFGKFTTSLYGKYFDSSTGQETSVLDQFAIVLDGKVVSAPSINSPITGGSGEISGSTQNPFTQNQATTLANVLKYGALPLYFHTQDVETISPTVGKAQLNAGLTAALVGLILVVIYSFFYYRGLGLVSVSSLAVAALLSYLAVVLMSKYEGFTLDLAGVAGLVVAIGITADSFVVYFERLRDEVREGRSLRAAVERGWTRARRTILVSDTVSFLAAALLYIFAIGDVKGFAFTLGLTTLIDVLVVFLFTKPMVTLLARTKFYGQGHKLSGLDPARLGARAPWRGSRRPAPRPAPGGAASATRSASRTGNTPTSPKEA
jgi:preprotein translocase subunit SecD